MTREIKSDICPVWCHPKDVGFTNQKFTVCGTIILQAVTYFKMSQIDGETY